MSVASIPAAKPSKPIVVKSGGLWTDPLHQFGWPGREPRAGKCLDGPVGQCPQHAPAAWRPSQDVTRRAHQPLAVNQPLRQAQPQHFTVFRLQLEVFGIGSLPIAAQAKACHFPVRGRGQRVVHNVQHPHKGWYASLPPRRSGARFGECSPLRPQGVTDVVVVNGVRGLNHCAHAEQLAGTSDAAKVAGRYRRQPAPVDRTCNRQGMRPLQRPGQRPLAGSSVLQAGPAHPELGRPVWPAARRRHGA